MLNFSALLELKGTYIHWHNRLAELTKKSAVTYKRRLAMYRMMEKMTGEPAALPVFDAISELQSLEDDKGLRSRMWYVYQSVIDDLRDSDANFAKAMGPYIPQQDVMVLAAAEQGDIDEGFRTLIENNKKVKEMKKIFSSALAYPSVLVVSLMGSLYFFCVKIIPQYALIIPATADISSNSKFLLDISKSFNIWFPAFCTFIVALAGFIIWALPNFNNKYRKHLEDLPPFNMYRIMVGGGFLFALNSLTKAGYQQVEALEQMVSLAKPYLKHRIQIILELMADGNDIGQALMISKLDFPDAQMVKELSIQTKYSDSDDSLEILSKTLAEDGIETIQVQAKSMNYIITFLVFGVILMLYLGVYQLGQDAGNIKVVSGSINSM